jgi:hypothetical protein
MFLTIALMSCFMEKSKFDVLEEKIYGDIATVRASLSLIFYFLNPLFNGQESHFQNYDAPLTNAMRSACFFSAVAGLGRLFNASPKRVDGDCDLDVFFDEVLIRVSALSQVDPKSINSKNSSKMLSDPVEFKKIKLDIKRYAKLIKNPRDKFAAHTKLVSDKQAIEKLAKEMRTIIDFAENLHRSCISALQNRSIPGQYVSSTFESVSSDWIRTLLKRKHFSK